MSAKKKRPASGPGELGSDDEFPETHTEILAEAAAGNWTRFLDEYLRPCWREIVIACRTRGLPLPDADDLYQELMVRLIRHSRFKPQLRAILAQQQQDPDFRGNLPQRYLKARELPFRTARFRTYLKEVIRNLVLEAIRARRRQPLALAEVDEADLAPWIEGSISRSLDLQWIARCLDEAAGAFWQESARSRTRGKRRLFEMLCLFTLEGQSAAEIAPRFGLDRTTASSLLSEAKARFILQLQRVTGMSDALELKALLADATEQIKAALARVRRAAGLQTGEEKAG